MNVLIIGGSGMLGSHPLKIVKYTALADHQTSI